MPARAGSAIIAFVLVIRIKGRGDICEKSEKDEAERSLPLASATD